MLCHFLTGYSRFARDIEVMLGHKPNIFFKACWLVITPVVIMVRHFVNINNISNLHYYSVMLLTILSQKKTVKGNTAQPEPMRGNRTGSSTLGPMGRQLGKAVMFNK